MKNIDLIKVNALIEEFIAQRDWDQFHSLKNLVMALSVESSELLEIFQWLTEEESRSLKDDPVKKQRLEEEVADVFVYLMRIVSKADINLEEVVLRKISANAEKYPVELSRGKATKYKDLLK